MKKLLCSILFLLTMNTNGAIVNNSGSRGVDSISFQFYLLDSIGNNTPLATTDSLGIFIFFPDGSQAFTSAILGDHGNITTSTLSNIGSNYVFAEAVENIDGVSASNGVYKWILTIKDISLGLTTTHSGEFQLYQSSDFDERLDYLNTPVSSRSVFNPTIDSVNARFNLDSTSIARSVWNTPQTLHQVPGTFGDYLDSDISGLSTGSGIYSQTIFVYDSVAGQPIGGVNLLVRNVSQTSLIALGSSDVNGFGSFNLDADSFLIIGYAPGFRFEAFDTIVVTGNSVDTLFGSQIDIGNPVSPNLCRVYGYVFGIDGLPESDAVVTANLPFGVVRSGNLIISPFSKSTLTDSLGYFQIDLIHSDSLNPTKQMYEFTISRSDGTVLRQRIEVPALTQWLLTW